VEKDILGEVIEVEKEILKRLKAEREKAGKWLEEEKKKCGRRVEEAEERLKRSLEEAVLDAVADARRKSDELIAQANRLAGSLEGLDDEALRPHVMGHISRILPGAE
jgi:hypothetical protein